MLFASGFLGLAFEVFCSVDSIATSRFPAADLVLFYSDYLGTAAFLAGVLISFLYGLLHSSSGMPISFLYETLPLAAEAFLLEVELALIRFIFKDGVFLFFSR